MTESALLKAAVADDEDTVLTVLATLNDKQRRGALRQLGALPPGDRSRPAVELAQLGCHTAAEATAKFLISRRRRFPRWSGPEQRALAHRDPDWLADVAQRLAAKMSTPRPGDWRSYRDRDGLLYGLAMGLALMSGRTTPTTDGFVFEWLKAVRDEQPQNSAADLIGWPDRPYGSAAAAFRADRHAAELLPRVLEIAGFGTYLVKEAGLRPVLIALSETGELDRRTLLDRCVGGVLRGGRPSDTRGFWMLLEEAQPTEDELADRVHDWAAVARDGDAPSVVRALDVLRRLWDAGRLPAELLTEVTHDVLARPERALARAQLKLVAQALRQAPENAGLLVPAVAAAFGHEDSVVQEQAWKLAARHLKGVGDAERTQVADALPRLTPDLRQQAEAVLGAAPATAEPVYVLPPVSLPSRAASPFGSPVEVVQELVAMLFGKLATPLDRERVLDGVIRHAYRDRTALVEALEPVVSANQWMTSDGIGWLLRAVLGEVQPDDIPLAPKPMSERHDCRECLFCVTEYLWTARLYEAARGRLLDPVPFLLATPSWSTGVVDAEVLLQRLADYAKLGVRAAGTDLDQALLRVRLPQQPDLDRMVAEAAALQTADGTRFARWLGTGGVQSGFDDRVLPALRAEGFTSMFRTLDRGLELWCPLDHRWDPAPLQRWVATVPVSREYLAAQLKPVGEYHNLDSLSAELPVLIEADGPAGQRLSEVISCGLVGAGPAERPGVLDALLQLAARGELDAQECGELLGRWRDHGHQPYDFTPVLAEAARVGADAVVWAVLSAALPGVLCRPALPRKLSALLTLAAESAARVGAKGDMPGLAALADSAGRSQSVKQAQRLRRILADNAGGTSALVLR